jgi:5-methylcytosine-specific restriction protein B
MEKLSSLIYEHPLDSWSNDAEQAFAELFGAENGRYPDRARKSIQIRAPKFSDDNNVPFSTLIEPSNPTSGPYGGMSVGGFPVEGSPCLIALGTGTTGLHPDEAILARPGHARKAQAICEAINRRENRFAAWAKPDPTRTDLPVPANVTSQFVEYEAPFKRYEITSMRSTDHRRIGRTKFVKAFLDLYFEERGFAPLTAHKADYEEIRNNISMLLPQ